MMDKIVLNLLCRRKKVKKIMYLKKRYILTKLYWPIVIIYFLAYVCNRKRIEKS